MRQTSSHTRNDLTHHFLYAHTITSSKGRVNSTSPDQLITFIYPINILYNFKGGGKHYLPTLKHPRHVCGLKGCSYVGLAQLILNPRSFISEHVQPTPLWNCIDIVDDEISYHAIYVCLVVAICSFLIRSRIVVDIMPLLICSHLSYVMEQSIKKI